MNPPESGPTSLPLPFATLSRKTCPKIEERGFYRRSAPAWKGFPKFRKSKGPRYRGTWGHATPGSQRDDSFMLAYVFHFHFGWNNIFRIVGNIRARDSCFPPFPLLFLLFSSGKGKKTRKGTMVQWAPRSRPTFLCRLTDRWSMGNSPRPAFLELCQSYYVRHRQFQFISHAVLLVNFARIKKY